LAGTKVVIMPIKLNRNVLGPNFFAGLSFLTVFLV
jgi:hypothetical protein